MFIMGGHGRKGIWKQIHKIFMFKDKGPISWRNIPIHKVIVVYIIFMFRHMTLIIILLCFINFIVERNLFPLNIQQYYIQQYCLKFSKIFQYCSLISLILLLRL